MIEFAQCVRISGKIDGQQSDKRSAKYAAKSAGISLVAPSGLSGWKRRPIGKHGSGSTWENISHFGHPKIFGNHILSSPDFFLYF
jgi:hypothetical protein